MKNFLRLLFLIAPIFVFSQKNISGVVLDEKNSPLSGATVKIKNTARSTYTNVDGSFELEIPKGKNILVISFLGFETQEVILEEETRIKVILIEKSESLKEVVVVGYGEVKKKDLTGSIVKLKPNEAIVNQSTSVESLLQGTTAGVFVNSQGFEPGSAINVQIRGLNSLSSNTQPLYIVDGIVVNSATEGELNPLSNGSAYLSPQSGLQGINPRDIESLEILKDASATAIYGSRGSNGVVIITTKKGRSGKAKFEYFVNAKFGRISKSIDVLNARDYALYQNKSRELKGFPVNYNVDESGNVYDLLNSNQLLAPVNWSDEIYRDAISYNHRISVSGGSDNNTYYIAAGHLVNEGVTPRTNIKQTDLNFNLNNKLTNKLKLNSKLGFTFSKGFGSKGTENLGGSNSSFVRQVISAAPFENFASNYYGENLDDVSNAIDGPRAWIQDYDDISKEIRGLGALNLEYTISSVFKYRALLGLDYRKKDRQIWYGTAILRGAQVNGEAGLSEFERFKYNLDNTLMFNKKFNKAHSINGTVGFVIEDASTTLQTYQASNFPIKDLRSEGISTGEVFNALRYDKFPEKLLSYIGRVNYNLLNRYNFTATFRADGSSKFSKENKFSYFPSLAFAWQVDKEKMFKKFSKLDDLMLRLSWGKTGNQAINPFQTLSLYNSVYYANDNGGGDIGLKPQFLQNKNLIWETTSQYNAGLDFGFFDKRLTASLDVFYKLTKDLLFQENIPGSSGFDVMFSNKGSLSNKGFEFSLAGDIIRKDNFTWNVYGNYSLYRNRLEDLNLQPRPFGNNVYSAYVGNIISAGNTFKTPANIFIEGQAAGLFWGFETNGIINNSDELSNAPIAFGQAPQLGDVLIVDQNKDGVINDSDKTIIGDPNPDFSYGFGTNLKYKNFSFNMFFNGVYGNDIANGNLLRDGYAVGNQDNIRPETFQNAWSPENPDGTYPRINYDLVDASGFTDRIIEDGSFLRLSNVTLSYSLPIANDGFIEAVDLSVAGNNLLLFTNYSGYDPEVNSFAFDPLRKGVDWQSFPNQRSFAFGLNIKF